MRIGRIEKAVHRIAPSVKVEEYRGCVRLTGELDNWEDIYRCGAAAVSKRSLGVLNDIKLKGFCEEIRKPSFEDKALEGEKPDVLVIGGGIVGCAIARELTSLNVSVLLADKGNDVATATSCRNDGCIHVGIDLHKGQQKLKYLLKGNEMYDGLSKDLGFGFKRWAQIFMFSTMWERIIIPPLYKLKAKILKIPGIRFTSAEEMQKLEPHPPKWLTGAMYMASGGVVSPYKVTIALAENAAENGARISLNTMVTGMDVENGVIKAVKTNRGTIYPKIVVNAAGVFSDVIADMAGDRTFTIHPRKGTDLILDKKKSYYALSSFARSYFAPLPKEYREEKRAVGHTKGGGVMRTVDGNILVGPDAVEQPYREDTTTSLDRINAILKKQSLAADELNRGDVITYFSGVRAATYEEDFVVRKGIFTKNIIEAAGIQSPGITAAPAIAADVRNWVKDALGASHNDRFTPVRKHFIPHLAELDEQMREHYIKKNPDYGEIVCRCEEVSRGEIIDALNSPLKVATIDGIKRRVRPGMGRCQGGFCSPLVAKIIAEHENIPIEQVLKGEEGSNILFGNTKKAMDQGYVSEKAEKGSADDKESGEKTGDALKAEKKTAPKKNTAAAKALPTEKKQSAEKKTRKGEGAKEK